LRTQCQPTTEDASRIASRSAGLLRTTVAIK
jgi:hypothetical protein